ncbi:hypothetical protein Tco_0956791 [Tanacetum coccineum]
MQIKERLKTAKSARKAMLIRGVNLLNSKSGTECYLRLPQELRCVHDVFHVSNLKKCLADSDLQVLLEEIKVDDKLYFVEEPVEIVDRQVKKLKRSWIPIVKVHWDSRRGAELTWEREDQFKAKYPHLFATSSFVTAAS